MAEELSEYRVEVGWTGPSRLLLVRARSVEEAARAAEDWAESNVSEDDKLEEMDLYSTEWKVGHGLTPDAVITAPDPEEPE